MPASGSHQSTDTLALRKRLSGDGTLNLPIGDYDKGDQPLGGGEIICNKAETAEDHEQLLASRSRWTADKIGSGVICNSARRRAEHLHTNHYVQTWIENVQTTHLTFR